MRFVLLACLLLLTPMAQAHDHDITPAGEAFDTSMDAMMKGMDVPMTGDTDRDFAAMMIPHHQGAVDMCKVELRYGKDADLKKLCTGIIKNQTKEIAAMKRWQAQH